MKRARRWGFGLTALLALGSCLNIPERPLAIAAVAAPERPKPVPSPTAPAVRNDFVLSGPLSQGGVVIGLAPSGTTVLSLGGMAIPIAPDGRFVIGFDRDAGPSAQLSATLADGRTIGRLLTIAPRAWDISRLDTLPKYPVPMPQFEKMRPDEMAQIAAARKMVTDAAGWRQPFLWPAVGRVSTLFGSQRIYKNGEAGSYHSGIDIAVPVGTPVLAPADGVVILASDHPFTLEGNLLMLDHGMGLSSALMHLSRIAVPVGARVKKGEIVAYSGMTGRVTGPHLHWSLKWREAKVDPLLVAGPMPRQ